jgi:hypothetical protein
VGVEPQERQQRAGHREAEGDQVNLAVLGGNDAVCGVGDRGGMTGE